MRDVILSTITMVLTLWLLLSYTGGFGDAETWRQPEAHDRISRSL